jgi:DNA repair protein RadC
MKRTHKPPRTVSYYTLKITRKLLRKGKPIPVTCSAHLAGYVRDYCLTSGEDFRENLFLVFINNEGNVAGHYLLAVGGTNCVNLDVRLACTCTLGAGVSRVALAHNHPSGTAMPSECDIRETERLKKALNTLGITLVDHVIVAEREFFSFNDEVRTSTSRIPKLS